MSLLSDYLLKEQQVKTLRQELQRLERDERLQAELEFKKKLEDLMGEFDKNISDVIAIVDPKGDLSSSVKSASTKATSGTRRKRKLKVYRNPHNGEVIETRGGNHKVLKAWKEQYGSDTVEGWLEEGQA
ncbi:histone-like nucleoid-structuring protein, MvaT/MvaU family [Carnimonas nigrificans]|uniref:histone-like nucleoid-structuring protein, MvaT/MvaU family n=1 Tax=Carnimonas nigrificans TaxID=64323 RepID=UPI00046F1393|nr:histone-like nucleoid-structuring protein, MvaT/MvaU family [Carnimonas nigrificans]